MMKTKIYMQNALIFLLNLISILPSYAANVEINGVPIAYTKKLKKVKQRLEEEMRDE